VTDRQTDGRTDKQTDKQTDTPHDGMGYAYALHSTAGKKALTIDRSLAYTSYCSVSLPF